MLEASIYYLLKKHFRQEKYYVDLLELFHEVRRPHHRTADSALLPCGLFLLEGEADVALVDGTCR